MNKENERVSEWEDGLLTPEELVPLTQALITPELALALSITQELAPAPVEIQLTTQSSIVSLCRQGNFPYSSELHHSLHTNVNLSDSPSLRSERGARSCEPPVVFPECGNGSCQHAKTDLSNNGSYTPQHGSSPGFGDNSPMPNGMIFGVLDKRLDNGYGGGISGMESNEYGGANVGKKPRKQLDTEFEDADSGGGLENSGEEPTARTLKRPRLVWTPQLHKRFVDAVAHLGIKNAVPKTIMQLMNVEGLTRENVASHLQKYRLYLKRMQGLSSEGPSVSDQLFASTPVPPSLAASTHFLPNHRDDIVPLIVPLQIAGLGHGHVVGPLGAAAPYASFDHHFYNLARPPAQRLPSGYQDFVIDNQGRSDSPQRRILTLFPTNGC